MTNHCEKIRETSSIWSESLSKCVAFGSIIKMETGLLVVESSFDIVVQKVVTTATCDVCSCHNGVRLMCGFFPSTLRLKCDFNTEI